MIAGTTVCCVLLVVDSLDWSDSIWLIFAPVLLLALGGAWLVLALVGAFAYQTWRLTAVSAVLVMAVALPAWFDLPRAASFHVSRSALESVADRCEDSGPQWAGSVRLTSVKRVDEVCLLYTPGGFIDMIGYARLPDGPPTDSRQRLNVSFTSYSDDWYTFVWHF